MFKNIGKLVISYFVLMMIFLIALTLSCLIPSTLLKHNIGKTLTILKNEGTYPSFGLPWRQIVLDNFTDTLMLNTAYSVNSDDPVKSALINLRYNGNDKGANQISNLENLYLNKDFQQVGYERYWHGYLIYLRPLLIIFSYPSIRTIMTIFLYSTFTFFIYLSRKKLGGKITISFIFGLIAVDFFYLGQSMQFSSVFLIGLLGSIYMLNTYKKNYSFYTLFFIAGSLTSFFDLLTAPLVTLGILLITATGLEKKNIKNIFLHCISWSAGYLLLWFSKWLIVDLLFTQGAIITGFNEIVNRTVSQADVNFSHLSAIKLNFFQLIGYSRISKIIVLFIFTLFSILFLRYAKFNKQRTVKILPWILVGSIPYIWYLIAANHSYLHVWYTYRNQFMSVVCLLIISSEFIDWPHFKKDLQLISKSTLFH